ncbi:MAG: hypothetical protein AB1430_21755 [Pseudomonadota bacterium]
MTKPVHLFIGAAIVLALAAALNPSPEQHRAKIKEAVSERSPVSRVLGIGALTAFASHYHSIGIASYTTAGDRTLSYGAFGVVFVADLEN